MAFSLLAIVSSLHWYVQLDDREGVDFGYWVQLVSVFSICVYSNFRSIKNIFFTKENAATIK